MYSIKGNVYSAGELIDMLYDVLSLRELLNLKEALDNQDVQRVAEILDTGVEYVL